MHYLYHHIKGKYFKKKTISLDKNQSEKYNKIMKEIEELRVSAPHKSVTEVKCSQEVPFKSEKEKEEMNRELLSFMNSQFVQENI